jgi:TonB family protein
MRSLPTTCVVGLIAALAVQVSGQVGGLPDGGPAPMRAEQGRFPRPAPLPQGQRLQASDGDLIVLDDEARLRVIRRRSGTVRAIYNEAQHWLVLLVDFDRSGAAADGRVDWHYQFQDVEGEWPLPPRWEGALAIEEYTLVGEGFRPVGIGLRLQDGLIQVIPPDNMLNAFAEPAARTLRFRGSGSGMDAATFDAAEQQQLAVAARNFASRGAGRSMSFQSSGGVTGGMGMVGPSTSALSPPPSAPVRVGGNVATPNKIVDAAPLMPDVARQAGIRGVVIIEATIGADGSVVEAKVLRSIPLLDAAALAAVKQWRYEPTLLNGAPVPVIMTVTVNFP